MLSQSFSVIIDSGIIVPGYGREVVDGLNAINKRFIFQLIATLKLPYAKSYDTHMVMHTGTRTSDVSLAREFQKHLSGAAHKYGVIDQVKYKKSS